MTEESARPEADAARAGVAHPVAQLGVLLAIARERLVEAVDLLEQIARDGEVAAADARAVLPAPGIEPVAPVGGVQPPPGRRVERALVRARAHGVGREAERL